MHNHLHGFALGKSEAPDIQVPTAMLASWQKTIDLMAELLSVPAGLIMHVGPNKISVFVASEVASEYYRPGESESLGSGLYCENVIENLAPLLIPDASVDPEWQNNPDMRFGMLAYFGVPILWPNGSVFGTVCVLDSKPNSFSKSYCALVSQFRDAVQLGLCTLYEHEYYKQAQERMMQSAKLASIGSIAAGLAHELNQPLGVISVANELSARLLEQPETEHSHRQLSEMNRKVAKQVGRASHIIDHLRIFGRQNSVTEYSEHAVNELIHEALVLLESKLHEHRIPFLLELAEELDIQTVKCDYIQINQVLVNLISNAIDAMKGMSPNEAKLTLRTRRDGDRVRLEVEDSGAGISKARQQLVFDPFYTTKAPDKGTGLGLSISYSLIKEHGGEIELKSDTGGGCCFSIALPYNDDAQCG